MANDGNRLSFSTLIAFTIAGMALAASVALAYYVTHPKRPVQGDGDGSGAGPGPLEH